MSPAVSILLMYALPALAVLIGIVVFSVNVNKDKTPELHVPSYNELKVENERLRRENAELTE